MRNVNKEFYIRRTLFSGELELRVLFPLPPLHLDEVVPVEHSLDFAVCLSRARDNRSYAY